MKILVPLDKSPRDGVILPYSANAARAYGAGLVLLSVVTLQRSIVPGATREVEAYLAAVTAGLKEQAVDAEYAVRKGDVAKIIVTCADELKCDMIVMASRGRSSLGKLVLGSVADAVLSSCGKPIFLLSEASNGVRVNDTVRQQSAYLATVLWNRQTQGHITGEEAKRKIELLAAEGLDEHVLMSTYHALEEQGGIPFGWLGIDFQLDTLRTFLPEEIQERTGEEPGSESPRRMAA